MTVTRTSRTPLYLQLEASLRRMIVGGELRTGDAIPSEADLGRRYSVSRITVRSAIDRLVQDGLLERFPGRGTFVKATSPDEWGCLTSFTDQMLRAGRRPETDLLRIEHIKGDERLEAMFGLASADEVVMIERLRMVDGEAAALVRSYIPHRFVPGITSEHFGRTGRTQSLLYVLERHFGITMDEGEETTSAVCLTAPEAGLLGQSDGSPAVLKVCLIHTHSGTPLLYEEALWCAPQTGLVRRRLTPDAT